MKKLIMSVLAMAALASCEQATENILPEPTPENNLVPIELRAKVLGMEAVTKAVMTAFNGEEIGVYALQGGETAGSYAWSATPYYHNTDKVAIGADGVITFTTPVYYPLNDKKVKFFAYYPKETTAADVTAPGANAPKVKYSITGQEDIMLATAESKALSAKEEVSLLFNHKLAKINFILAKGDGFPADSKVNNIILTDCYTKLEMDLGTGNISNDNTTKGNLTAFDYNNDASKAITIPTASNATVGEIMIEPGATYGLSVTVNGVTAPFTATGLTAPAAGEQQTVTLTFKGTAISTKATIGTWGSASNNASDKVDIQK